LVDARTSFLASVRADRAARYVLPTRPTFTPKQTLIVKREWIPTLMLIAQLALSPLSVLGERLGLTASQVSRLMKQMVDAGAVEMHEFTSGKRGGPLKVPMLTATAWQEVKAFGIEPAKTSDRECPEHVEACRGLEELGRRLGNRVDGEVLVGDVRLDVVWRDKRGKTTYLNVGITSPQREANAAGRAIEHPAVVAGTFILVGRDKSFLEAVTKLVKDDRVVLRQVGHVIHALYSQEALV